MSIKEWKNFVIRLYIHEIICCRNDYRNNHWRMLQLKAMRDRQLFLDSHEKNIIDGDGHIDQVKL